MKMQFISLPRAAKLLQSVNFQFLKTVLKSRLKMLQVLTPITSVLMFSEQLNILSLLTAKLLKAMKAASLNGQMQNMQMFMPRSLLIQLPLTIFSDVNSVMPAHRKSLILPNLKSAKLQLQPNLLMVQLPAY